MDIIEVTDEELRDALGQVAAQREAAEAMATTARDNLATAATEAIMANWTLRDVAAASGYSISAVRRAKLDAHQRRAGWYPAVTREHWQQYYDGTAWVLQFRRPPSPNLGAPKPGSAANLPRSL